METVLVLGGTGFLGSSLVPSIQKRGFAVRTFARHGTTSGDLSAPQSLSNALEGVSTVVVALPWKLERSAVALLLAHPRFKQGTPPRIVYTSGVTAVESNQHFDVAREKFETERLLATSGADFTVFKPGWFFESVKLFVRGDQASLFGKHTRPLPFLSIRDFARVVALSLGDPSFRRQTVVVAGREQWNLQTVLERYLAAMRPSVKLSVLSLGFGRVLGWLSGSRELKDAVALMDFFSHVSTWEKGSESTREIDCGEFLGCNEWLNLERTESEHA